MASTRVVKGIIPDRIVYPHPHYLPIFCLNLRKKGWKTHAKAIPFTTLASTTLRRKGDTQEKKGKTVPHSFYFSYTKKLKFLTKIFFTINTVLNSTMNVISANLYLITEDYLVYVKDSELS
jgi:hypothetical protein